MGARCVARPVGERKMTQIASAVGAPRSALSAPDPRRWWVLGIVVAAQFIYVVDAFIVNVGLPSIKLSLGATAGETQGVIVCYLTAFATLVVTGGRLGDIYGSKRVFLTGLFGFTAASLA